MDRAPNMAEVPVRLTPAMASSRLLVLAFVQDYIGRFRVGPSQGEISAALDFSRSRVRDALRSLERDGLILRGGGERGLSLPSQEQEAVRQLVAAGWLEHEGVLFAPGTDPVFPLLGEAEL